MLASTRAIQSLVGQCEHTYTIKMSVVSQKGHVLIQSQFVRYRIAVGIEARVQLTLS